MGIFLYHFNEDVFQYGFLGVDVFFVISGYVIYPKLRRIFDGSRSVMNGVLQFYERRIWRLLPAFIVAMLISGALLFITAPLEDHKRIWGAAILSLVGLGNLAAYKFSGDYFNPNPNPFVHTWSLAVEEQIYLLLPIILLLGYLVSAYLSRIILYFLSFASVLLATNETATDLMLEKLGVKYASLLDMGFYLPTHRFWQFGLGAICAAYIGRIRVKDSLWKILFFLLALLMLFPTRLADRSFQTSLVLVVGLTLLIDQQKGLPNKGFPFLFLRSIGDRSYSLYLIHMPIIYILRYSPLIPDDFNEFEIFLLYVMATFLLTDRVLFPLEKKYRMSGTQ